jgi:hypothetical protein
VPLRERDAEIEAEEVRVGLVLVLHHDLDVRHGPAQLVRKGVERPAHVLLEAQ